MDLEAILVEMSSKLGMTVDDLKNTNIDEVFQEEPTPEEGYATAMLPLIDYVCKYLPGYYIDLVPESGSKYDFVNVVLRKCLKEERRFMKEGQLNLNREDLVTVELASFDLSALDAKELFKSSDYEFRRIGPILERIKQAYDFIEQYLRETQPAK